ncbi:hypothetical protein ACX80E_06580 [Arthrobacter sp. TMN-49]
MSDDDEEKVPAAEILGDLKFNPIDVDETARELFLLLKVTDGDGEVSWSFRKSSGITDEEMLGVLRVQKSLLLNELLNER